MNLLIAREELVVAEQGKKSYFYKALKYRYKKN
jgi:hypothetical protein